MFYVKALVLAIIEGLTEFLPISSTGHLILADSLLRLSENKQFVDAFVVLIQLPAILAVVVYFRNDLWPFGAGAEVRTQRFRLWLKVCAAFVPAAVAGYLFDDVIERKLLFEVPVAIALILGGIAFILIERGDLPIRFETVEAIAFRHAIAIGLFQCLALVPGVSRSGASIFGAMMLGAARPAAARFSFYLAIPTMGAAWAYTVLKTGLSFSAPEWIALVSGSAVSFAVAYAVVAFLMGFVQRHRFTVFGYYRIVLGAIVLILFLVA